jgi:hypothetical protein
LQRSGRFSRRDLGRIRNLLSEHRIKLLEAWNEYFRG